MGQAKSKRRKHNEFGLGWYSFDLRAFNPVIARWHNAYPYNQYSSPYIAMGNNPVNMIDPNGGESEGANNICKTWEQSAKELSRMHRYYMEGAQESYMARWGHKVGGGASNVGHSDKYLANKARIENTFENNGVEGITTTAILDAINQGMSGSVISQGIKSGLLQDGYTIKDGVWGKYESKSMLINNGDSHNAVIGADKDTYTNDDWNQTSMVPSTLDEYAFGEFFVPLNYTDLFAGALQPVAYSLEFNGFAGAGIGSSASPFGVMYISQGASKGYTNGYSTAGFGASKMSIGVSVIYTQYMYIGNINHLDYGLFKGLCSTWNISAGAILQGGLGISIAPNLDYNGELLIGVSGSFTIGLQMPINYYGGVNYLKFWNKK